MQTRTWKKSLALLISMLLLTAMVLTGCGSKEQEPEQTEEEIVWVTAPEETMGIAVDNAYMTFYYPQEWEGKVEEVREETDGNITVTFRTDISGREVVLFSVVMGPGVVEEGYLLGQLKDPQAGTINVYSIMNEINSADWSEEDYSQIIALQERVNDIIVQFYQDERFVPSR